MSSKETTVRCTGGGPIWHGEPGASEGIGVTGWVNLTYSQVESSLLKSCFTFIELHELTLEMSWHSFDRADSLKLVSDLLCSGAQQLVVICWWLKKRLLNFFKWTPTVILSPTNVILSANFLYLPQFVCIILFSRLLCGNECYFQMTYASFWNKTNHMSHRLLWMHHLCLCPLCCQYSKPLLHVMQHVLQP